LKNIEIQNFMEILPFVAEMVNAEDRREDGGERERKTEGQKDITMLREAFNNFTIVPEYC